MLQTRINPAASDNNSFQIKLGESVVATVVVQSYARDPKTQEITGVNIGIETDDSLYVQKPNGFKTTPKGK